MSVLQVWTTPSLLLKCGLESRAEFSFCRRITFVAIWKYLQALSLVVMAQPRAKVGPWNFIAKEHSDESDIGGVWTKLQIIRPAIRSWE